MTTKPLKALTDIRLDIADEMVDTLNNNLGDRQDPWYLLGACQVIISNLAASLREHQAYIQERDQ